MNSNSNLPWRRQRLSPLIPMCILINADVLRFREQLHLAGLLLDWLQLWWFWRGRAMFLGYRLEASRRMQRAPWKGSVCSCCRCRPASWHATIPILIRHPIRPEGNRRMRARDQGRWTRRLSSPWRGHVGDWLGDGGGALPHVLGILDMHSRLGSNLGCGEGWRGHGGGGVGGEGGLKETLRSLSWAVT